MNDQRDPNQPYGPPSVPPPGWSNFTQQHEPPSPPRKSHRLRTALIVAGTAVVGLAVIGVLVPDAKPSGEPIPNVVSTQATPTPPPPTVTVTTPVAPTATETTTQAPPPPKPAAKRWVKLSLVSGTRNREGKSFTVTGGDVRIRYSFKDTSGYGLMMGAVYVMDDGKTLRENGGIPELMVSSADANSADVAADVHEMRLAAGTYYLSVSAANAKFSVTIEEYR